MPRAMSASLTALLLSAISPALAAQSALTSVPGSERAWDVTCDITVPVFTQGRVSEFVISIPSNGAASAINPVSVAATSRIGQPITVTLAGADSEPSRPLMLSGPGVIASSDLQVSFTTRVWNTRIDERIARARRWPDAAWPSDLMPFLEPDRSVQSGLPSIREFVEANTGANSRAQPPYDLAKRLAAAAINHCRNAPSRSFSRAASQTSGLHRIVMARAADNRELPLFLCALYRAAGLPARVVRGVDVGDAETGTALPCQRAWVEFLLPGADENAAPEWIPVDIVRQRESSSRAPSLESPWLWFGNNMDSNFVIPFASSPSAPAVTYPMFMRQLWADCSTCPERWQSGRSNNLRGVRVQSAVRRPNR